MNRFLNKVDARVDVEFFADDEENGHRDGPKTRRAKGTIGVDVVLWKPMGSRPPAKPYLVFDLKTGKGFSSDKRGRISRAFGGATVVEIFVRKK
jgi:hypothetical protein